ncbi:hypothetical protein [Maribacter sp. 2308TA10-17]|uniref:hypothetical protein n=1 Tax=Maribacter sp. 2308TA10-17 TaxID=3386276 RepID=UPI0039BD3F09
MNQTILEALKNNYFFILYFATFAIALVRYRRYFDSILKYFPIFIGYTILTELLGFMILNFETFQINYSEEYPYANNAIYNIYDLVFFFYFYTIFFKVIKKRKSKTLIKYGALAYVIATVINPFFEDWIIFPQTYALTIGSAVLIMTILLYFRDSKHRIEKNNNLLVWISIGLLVFNLFFPLIMLTALYSTKFYQEFHLRQIHHLLIVVMYGCFIIGFLQMNGKHTTIYEDL